MKKKKLGENDKKKEKSIEALLSCCSNDKMRSIHLFIQLINSHNYCECKAFIRIYQLHSECIIEELNQK